MLLAKTVQSTRSVARVLADEYMHGELDVCVYNLREA